MPTDTNLEQLIINKLTKEQFDSASGDENELWLVEDDVEYALKSDIPTNNNQLTNGAGYVTSSYHDSSKQNTITDLATIRSGASKGATAVQDSNYVHTDNNYTTDEKNKLASLENYDDTELRNKIDNLIDDDSTDTSKTWSSQKIADELEDIELAKFPNVTIIGQPTIQQGQISNFTSSNYCQFPFIVDFQNQAFELDFEITTGNEVTQQHNIFDSAFGLAFAVRNSKFVVAISTNGTSWNIGEVLGSHVVLPNTTYRIKMVWDKANLTLSYSTDGGETYVLDTTRALTEQPYPKQMFIGITSDKSTVFNGIINLNFAKLTIANKVVWQGMDDVGLATRANVSLSNLDEMGVSKIKDVILEEGYSKFSGNYNDLSNKPALKTVATSGSYSDLTNKPTIPTVPTNVSAFTNDAGYLTTHQDISGKQDKITETNKLSASLVDGLATVATTGSYNDLSGKPTIPTVPTNVSAFTNDAGYLTSHQDISGKQDKITSTNKLSASLVSGLATVATSGSYSDLSNKPTIPTVNNATLTIQKNGTNVQTFTANASSNATANITVPTKISELTNDSGYTKNAGTVTSVAVKINGSTKGTITSSGTIDLGSGYLTSVGKTLTSGTSLLTKTYSTNSSSTIANIENYSVIALKWEMDKGYLGMVMLPVTYLKANYGVVLNMVLYSDQHVGFKFASKTNFTQTESYYGGIIQVYGIV